MELKVTRSCYNRESAIEDDIEERSSSVTGEDRSLAVLSPTSKFEDERCQRTETSSSMCIAASDGDDEGSDDDQVQREDVFSTSAMHLVEGEDNVVCTGERDEKVAECNEHDLSLDESDICGFQHIYWWII